MATDVAQLEISAADIRHRVASGAPIRYFVPPPVERYIDRHGLYRA
jgi:nicotinate-nucleotide adenylyltransferase